MTCAAKLYSRNRVVHSRLEHHGIAVYEPVSSLVNHDAHSASYPTRVYMSGGDACQVAERCPQCIIHGVVYTKLHTAVGLYRSIICMSSAHVMYGLSACTAAVNPQPLCFCTHCVYMTQNVGANANAFAVCECKHVSDVYVPLHTWCIAQLSTFLSLVSVCIGSM